MSFSDAAGILLSGQEDAATQYFKRVTSAQLSAKFRPVIESSLSRVGATRYWGDAIGRYSTYGRSGNPRSGAFPHPEPHSHARHRRR